MRTRGSAGNSKNEEKKSPSRRNRESLSSPKSKGNAKSQEVQEGEKRQGTPRVTRHSSQSVTDLQNDAADVAATAKSPKRTSRAASKPDATDESLEHNDTNSHNKKRRSPRTKSVTEPNGKKKKVGEKRLEVRSDVDEEEAPSIKTKEEAAEATPQYKDSEDVTPADSLLDHKAENYDEESCVPIREVQTSRAKLHKGKQELDEPTLSLMMDCLETRRDDQLEEDELVQLSIKLNRFADQQVASQQSMAHGKRGEDSESGNESDDSSVFAECLLEEEDHSLGHDLMKKLQYQMQSKREKGSGAFGAPGTLQRKTVTWVRKAAGLVVRGDQLKKNLTGRISTRRFTRKQARESRQRKRERGLDILGAAVTELEEEYGPFLPPRRSKQKRSLNADGSEKSRKRIKNDNREAEDSSVKRTGRNFKLKSSGDKTSKSSKREVRKQRRNETNQWVLSQVRLPPRLDIDNSVVKAHVDLAEIARLWREETGSEVPTRAESLHEFKNRKEILLDPSIMVSGIVHRPASLDSLVRDQGNTMMLPGKLYDNANSRHDSRSYAEMTTRLMGSLGRTRAFVAAEFFYSDLDREWYNYNPLVAAFASLGIPSDTQLSKGEWKTLRRLMSPKPRRFSKSFISSQLNDRNLYRCTIRRIQNRPRFPAPDGFPFDVLAPIDVGSVVTAYCKRYRAIQRGRVLAYDKASAAYFVEFENSHFRHEICPDSDVATSGVPRILVKGASHPELIQTPNSCQLGRPSVASGSGPLAVGLEPGDPVAAFELMVSQAPPSGKLRPFQKPRGKLTAFDAANGDAFLELLHVLDKARFRTADILELESKLSAETCNASDSQVIEEHLRWLQIHKEKACQALGKGIEYQRSLFGHAYSKDAVEPETTKPNRLLDKCIEEFAFQEEQKYCYTGAWPQKLKEVAQQVKNHVIPKVEGSEDVCPINERLESAIELLSMATMSGHLLSSEHFVGNTETLRMITENTNALVKNSLPPAPAASHVYSGLLSAREEAATELKEAVAGLQTEFIIAHTKAQLNESKGVAL